MKKSDEPVSVEDFDTFFKALHEYAPFPWQTRLMERVASEDWPGVLDLPTASGKTAAIDVAVFHLALEAHKPPAERIAPRRIFFVVDRRVVVDEAYRRAQKIARKLNAAEDGVLKKAADALLKYGGDQPLGTAVLRGGMARDDGWATSPVQPVIAVSTVDQVGSRLLFRGYGLSDSMRPIHAALVGCDSLIILDEAHLSEPFKQTLTAIQEMREFGWKDVPVQPVQFVEMTATPAKEESPDQAFPQPDERAACFDDDKLRKRFGAKKPARLVAVKTKANDTHKVRREALAYKLVSQALDLAGVNSSDGRKGKKAEPSAPANAVVGVVVNRVATAREVYRLLKDKAGIGEDHRFHVILLTGRIRPFDRDELLFRCPIPGQKERGWLRFMKAGRKASLGKPLFVVATQTIEAGADLDFDRLVTEAAPLDALRQRFGRLNRLGDRSAAEGETVAAIVASIADIKKGNDPVYGESVKKTWEQLNAKNWCETRGKEKFIDFGIDSFKETIGNEDLSSMLSPKSDAPVLLPAHLDTLAQTSPRPVPEPEVSLYLHGPRSGPADVQVVWREDLLENLGSVSREELIATVNLVPPSSPEALAVPLHEVRRWLEQTGAVADVADVEMTSSEAEPRRTTERSTDRRPLRWRGPENDETKVIRANRDLSPGDTIIVPASWGGCDRFGWNPSWAKPVEDIAEPANLQARHRALLRKPFAHLNERGEVSEEEVGDGLRKPTRDDLVALQDRGEPPWLGPFLAEWLRQHPDTFREPFRRQPMADGRDWLLAARRRWDRDAVRRALGEKDDEDGDFSDAEGSTTEGDAGSFTGEPISLDDHTRHVCDQVRAFATACDLPDALATSYDTAALLHDLGKADRRFQVWMHQGNEVAAARNGTLLAKSGLPSYGPASGMARERAGWPQGYRHEGISVALANSGRDVLPTDDHLADLILYLIGTHHGHGRPFFPPTEDEHPEQVQFLYDGKTLSASSDHRLHHLSSGWADRFWVLTRQHGHWGLAWLEALLRLADQAASRAE